MDRILKEPFISHTAMENCIDAVLQHARRTNILFPSAKKLMAAARDRFPNGGTPSQFIPWLEKQEIQPSPEDLQKD